MVYNKKYIYILLVALLVHNNSFCAKKITLPDDILISGGVVAGVGLVSVTSPLILAGGLLMAGVGIYYAVENDKNYQAFVNLLKEPFTIGIIYHTAACPHDDRFDITPGDHRILYPKACQPKTITVYKKGTNEVLAQRSFIVGESGGRHGDWQLIQGSKVGSVVIKERQFKGKLENYQWFENTLNDTIDITVSYHGESKAFKSCRPDYLSVAPGGNAQANPKGCLLKKITVSNRDKKAHPTISGFERSFKLGKSGTAHGSWRITPRGIEGPL